MPFGFFKKKKKEGEKIEEKKTKEKKKLKKEKLEEKKVKKQEEASKGRKKDRAKKEKTSKEIKSERAPIRKEQKKKIPIELLDILVSPHVTEKASLLEGENKYVFRVRKNANKVQIRRAVEAFYGVNAISVRIVNVHPKKRRLGRIEGKRGGYKKAIVKIKKGEKIQILSK